MTFVSESELDGAVAHELFVLGEQANDEPGRRPNREVEARDLGRQPAGRGATWATIATARGGDDHRREEPDDKRDSAQAVRLPAGRGRTRPGASTTR